MKELKFWSNELRQTLSKLSEIKEIKDFTFVGGSALTYYLKHRISYDIDLFSSENVLNFKKIDKIIDKLKNFYKITQINRNTEQVDYIINDVNVTFCASGLSQLENYRSILKENLYIGSLELLVAMKVYAIGRRATIKDYFDIYTVLKRKIFTLNELKEITEKIFGEYFFKKLFFKQLLLISEVEDSLNEFDILIDELKVNKDEIKDFFKKEIDEAIRNS